MDWAEESLGYLVNRSARVFAQALARRIALHGVAIGQWAVLLFLYARDGQTQAELSRVVAIEPPTMVRTIDRMVRDGLVTRRADPSDRRVSRIHLTPKAIDLRDRLFAEATAVNATAASVLSSGELDQLKESLRRVTAAVDASSSVQPRTPVAPALPEEPLDVGDELVPGR